jgi:hypothetical protein
MPWFIPTTPSELLTEVTPPVAELIDTNWLFVETKATPNRVVTALALDSVANAAIKMTHRAHITVKALSMILYDLFMSAASINNFALSIASSRYIFPLSVT